jgi:hypothetical protein
MYGWKNCGLIGGEALFLFSRFNCTNKSKNAQGKYEILGWKKKKKNESLNNLDEDDDHDNDDDDDDNNNNNNK